MPRDGWLSQATAQCLRALHSDGVAADVQASPRAVNSLSHQDHAADDRLSGAPGIPRSRGAHRDGAQPLQKYLRLADWRRLLEARSTATAYSAAMNDFVRVMLCYRKKKAAVGSRF